MVEKANPWPPSRWKSLPLLEASKCSSLAEGKKDNLAVLERHASMTSTIYLPLSLPV